MKNVLTYKNNWENDVYYVDGALISDLKRVKIGRKSYKVDSMEKGVEVNDMGHTYRAYSKHYYIREKIFGLEMTFDLNRIVPKRKIQALYFTVEKV